MSEQVRRDFESVAARWDSNPGRVRIAHDVATAIRHAVALRPDLDMLDYGCGTGLLGLQLLPHVRSLTGADSSPAMLQVLSDKVGDLEDVRIQLVDFEHGAHATGTYDLIVSSMVAHHVPDTGMLFKEWMRLLKPHGQIAFADLDSEDGAFHGDNTGVFHLGFDRDHLRQLLLATGFRTVHASTATTVRKEIEGQGMRDFPIFLIVAGRD